MELVAAQLLVAAPVAAAELSAILPAPFWPSPA